MEVFDSKIGQRAFHSGALRPISGGITINQDTAKAYNGATIVCSAALTIMISGPLPGDFGCTIICPASGNVSVAADASLSVLLNGAGTTVTRAAAQNGAGFALYIVGNNSYIVSGA